MLTMFQCCNTKKSKNDGTSNGITAILTEEKIGEENFLLITIKNDTDSTFHIQKDFEICLESEWYNSKSNTWIEFSWLESELNVFKKDFKILDENGENLQMAANNLNYNLSISSKTTKKIFVSFNYKKIMKERVRFRYNYSDYIVMKDVSGIESQKHLVTAPLVSDYLEIYPK